MKVIDHNFLYSSFHPKKDNIVICLERNHYPKDMEIFDLHHQKEDNEEAKGAKEENKDGELKPDVPSALAKVISEITKDKTAGDHDKADGDGKNEDGEKEEATQGIPFEFDKEVTYEAEKEKAT